MLRYLISQIQKGEERTVFFKAEEFLRFTPFETEFDKIRTSYDAYFKKRIYGHISEESWREHSLILKEELIKLLEAYSAANTPENTLNSEVPVLESEYRCDYAPQDTSALQNQKSDTGSSYSFRGKYHALKKTEGSRAKDKGAYPSIPEGEVLLPVCNISLNEIREMLLAGDLPKALKTLRRKPELEIRFGQYALESVKSEFEIAENAVHGKLITNREYVNICSELSLRMLMLGDLFHSRKQQGL